METAGSEEHTAEEEEETEAHTCGQGGGGEGGQTAAQHEERGEHGGLQAESVEEGAVRAWALNKRAARIKMIGRR